MQPRRVAIVATTFVLISLSGHTANAAQPGGLVSPDVRADGQITFRLRVPKAEKVSVICEAVGTQPMTKDADGVWSVTVGPVAPGIYDCLLARNREFVKALDDLKVRHTYRETDGRHAWGVWRGYLAEFLPLLFR
jgi:hypothetical protein